VDSRGVAAGTAVGMQIPREMVIERIRSDHPADVVARAEQELPEKLDTEDDRELLESYGLDPDALEDDHGGQAPNVG
jgi:hypothetical protein